MENWEQAEPPAQEADPGHDEPHEGRLWELREMAPKTESLFSVFSDVHEGQGRGFAVPMGTSSSNRLSQSLQRYSYIGMRRCP